MNDHSHNPISPVAPDLAAGETAVLNVDLEAISDNYEMLRGFAPGAECAGVVKGDGYGTGAEQAARILHRQGCRTFFVATLAEATTLRRVLADAAIYSLSGFYPGSGDIYLRHDVRPVLCSIANLEDWAAFCRNHSNAPPAALHIDTGMNRLGLGADELGAVLSDQHRYLAPIRLDLVMSHLSCADEPHHPRNPRQLKLFNAARAQLPPMRASLANSAGIMLGRDYHFDLVRPGIALYGGRAVEKGPNPMRHVVTLISHIAQVRVVEPGDSIGYGATYTTQRRTMVATVPVGYADGYFRALACSNERAGANVCIAGRLAPLLGRVSMDLITVDITDLPSGSIRPGTPVEVIGAHIDVDELAESAGTIGYEILTSLGRRYRRYYLGS